LTDDDGVVVGGDTQRSGSNDDRLGPGVAELYVVLPACEAVTATVPAPVKVSFPAD
jgi:hypothetical protein